MIQIIVIWMIQLIAVWRIQIIVRWYYFHNAWLNSRFIVFASCKIIVINDATASRFIACVYDEIDYCEMNDSNHCKNDSW